MGCLDVGAHRFKTVLGTDYTGKVNVNVRRNSCDRPECPVCAPMWAGREARRASKRIMGFRATFKLPIHVVISPDQKYLDEIGDWQNNFESFRSQVLKVAKLSGIEGGCLVIHPFRKVDGEWVNSPHFHIVGYGWIKDTDKVYEETGWLVKNLGVRRRERNVRLTIAYELGHAGVRKGTHTLTWFGKLSYNKLRVVGSEKEKVDLEFEIERRGRKNVQVIVIEEEKEVCTICGGKLHRVHWDGHGPPPAPDEEGSYVVESEGWRESDMNFYSRS